MATFTYKNGSQTITIQASTAAHAHLLLANQRRGAINAKLVGKAVNTIQANVGPAGVWTESEDNGWGATRPTGVKIAINYTTYALRTRPTYESYERPETVSIQPIEPRDY